MSEADVIAAVSRPATVTSLVGNLRALGLGEGDTVMVHSSLSALGYVQAVPRRWCWPSWRSSVRRGRSPCRPIRPG